ncbi:MAG TPA: DUF4956 domain-containing protein [Anaerolineaceae bacterium]|jgi:uncharacterized membrane protein YhiD involved in acid resistance|nr:DUF4956 domain-containing protein [Anaerolineaceae bacterium]
MFNTIISFIQNDLVDALYSLLPELTSLIFSFLLGIFIFYVYRRFYKGIIYNHGFSITLAAMTILSTIITLAISSNIALSLGMVGALSIVRYRTAIKDPIDIMFLFWGVATGITIGAKMHYLALIGAVIVFILFLVLNSQKSNKKMYILLFHYSMSDTEEELKQILRKNRYQIKSKTMRQEKVEIAIELVVRNENFAFMEAIKELPTVTDVTLVQYEGEYFN